MPTINVDALTAYPQVRASVWSGCARAAGYTWADIGALLGTTGQAASQRYGHRIAA